MGDSEWFRVLSDRVKKKLSRSMSSAAHFSAIDCKIAVKIPRKRHGMEIAP